MTPDALLDLFRDTSAAVRDAVHTVQGGERRARTDRPGQYAIDLVADAAALEVLRGAPVAVVSEESGVSGPSGAPITVVIDPVDGSSNASRHLPYWATSLCALDGEGMVAALVENQATGSVSTATRGGGAFRDGEPLRASEVVRVEDAFVALSTFPGRMLAWKQFRALGSCALALCDTAAGIFDGYLDGGSVHAPWDYLGGALICAEAGAAVIDAGDRPLVTADPNARRHLVAAGTPALLEALRSAAG
jgi:fructose-1,6-bisphosphatase/inositol monophosphatase family enzyme